MKLKYPEYKQGDLQILKKKLSANNKKILDEFAKLCLITASPKKVEKEMRHIVQFYDVTELDLDKQTKESVNNFLGVLNNSNRSTHTKNEIKSYLKKFLKWKYRDLEMIENIKTECSFNYQKINEGNLVTEADIEKMLRFAGNYKDKAFIFLLYESGARPQEIVNLRWKDVKFEDEYADITFYSGKTGQSRTFPVKKSKQYLWEWKQNFIYDNVKPSDYIFPARTKLEGEKVVNRETPISTTALNKTLRRVAEKAGIDKNFWSYLFRHTRATKLYEELPTPIVEQLMGHQNMYKVYAHISSKKAREELLKKVYNVTELSPDKKSEYEKRIKELEKWKEDVIKLAEERDKRFIPSFDKKYKEIIEKMILIEKKLSKK